MSRPSRWVVALAVVASLAIAPGAAPDDGPTKFVVSLDGPPGGQVGDLLTFQVGVSKFSNGPTAGAKLEFTVDANRGLWLETHPENCVGTVASDVVHEECDFPAVGWTGTLGFDFGLRVKSVTPTLVTAWVQPNGLEGTSALSALGPPDRITNVVPPRLTAGPTVGKALQITNTGSFSPFYNYRHTYRWLRCTPDLGSCASFDTGSFGTTWIVTSADAGCRMAVVDIASSENGSGTGQSAFTDPVQPVQTCNPNANVAGPGPTGGTAPATLTFAADLLHAVIGAPYSATLVTSSSKALQVTFVEGAPPFEFKFDAASYRLYGTPLHAGTRLFSIQAFDPVSGIGERHSYELVVDDAPGSLDAVRAEQAVRARLALTPGADDPAVRQATIGRTICTSRWMSAVRPPASFLRRLKLRQMPSYDEIDPSAYVEDHFVPLELGGAPRNPKNLWPQSTRRAAVDNALEQKLRREVCAGRLSLASARREIAHVKRSLG